MDELLQVLGKSNIVPSRVEIGDVHLESLYLEVAKQ